MFNTKLLVIVKVFRKWRYYLIYILCFTKIFIDYLNYYYLIIKAKLNGKKVKWIEELTTFDFTIIYYKKTKNPIYGLS